MIGIIGAMEEEVALLKEQMQIEKKVEKASMEFCAGKLNGQEAVVVRSGIGKVNAGICTQILVDLFEVDAVINTGIAGSLDARSAEDRRPGDLHGCAASRHGCGELWLCAGADSTDGYAGISGR